MELWAVSGQGAPPWLDLFGIFLCYIMFHNENTLTLSFTDKLKLTEYGKQFGYHFNIVKQDRHGCHRIIVVVGESDQKVIGSAFKRTGCKTGPFSQVSHELFPFLWCQDGKNG